MADLPIEGQLADFDRATSWLNSTPLTAADLPERLSLLVFGPTPGGPHSHRILEGIGHNVPQEVSGAFKDAILEVGGGLR